MRNAMDFNEPNDIFPFDLISEQQAWFRLDGIDTLSRQQTNENVSYRKPDYGQLKMILIFLCIDCRTADRFH